MAAPGLTDFLFAKEPDKAPESLKRFRSWVALQRVIIEQGGEEHLWRFYDWGPRDCANPLVLLPGVSGTAEVFYRQFLSLCPKGYRLVAVHPPPAWTHDSWVDGFDRFLDAVRVQKATILGTALGGFQAQLYAQARPQRVRSLILNNSFVSTSYFSRNGPSVWSLPYLPEFVLKRIVLASLPDSEVAPEIADSIDFVVEQIERLDQADLASRLTLNTLEATLDKARALDPERVTIIDTMDELATPDELRADISKHYDGKARVALLKEGGNFPFLSRADEFTMHIELHYRRLDMAPIPPPTSGAAGDEVKEEREEAQPLPPAAGAAGDEEKEERD